MRYFKFAFIIAILICVAAGTSEAQTIDRILVLDFDCQGIAKNYSASIGD